MSRQNTIIVCLFLTLFVGVVLLYPQYQDLKFFREQVEEREIELQFKKEYLANLTELSEELKKYEEQLILIDSALPPNPSLPALFDFLQKTASQNGLILKEIDHTPTPSSEEGLRETRVSLKTAGSYSSLKSFLSALEKSARIIELESLFFSTPEVEGEIFSFDLTVKVFSY